jgi:hypothetical protein
LLLRLEAAHWEAAENDPLWTPAAIAFTWNYRRLKVNRLSPEQQEAYTRNLQTELAEAGSTKAWLEKLLAQRRKPAHKL